MCKTYVQIDDVNLYHCKICSKAISKKSMSARLTHFHSDELLSDIRVVEKVSSLDFRVLCSKLFKEEMEMAPPLHKGSREYRKCCYCFNSVLCEVSFHTHLVLRHYDAMKDKLVGLQKERNFPGTQVINENCEETRKRGAVNAFESRDKIVDQKRRKLELITKLDKQIEEILNYWQIWK